MGNFVNQLSRQFHIIDNSVHQLFRRFDLIDNFVNQLFRRSFFNRQLCESIVQAIPFYRQIFESVIQAKFLFITTLWINPPCNSVSSQCCKWIIQAIPFNRRKILYFRYVTFIYGWRLLDYYMCGALYVANKDRTIGEDRVDSHNDCSNR